jgi:hypothetical protein
MARRKIFGVLVTQEQESVREQKTLYDKCVAG